VNEKLLANGYALFRCLHENGCSEAMTMRSAFLFLLSASFLVTGCAYTCATEEVSEYSKDNEPGTKAEPEYVPDELLVTFRECIAESRTREINESLNVQVIRTLLSGRIHLIKVPKEKSLEETRQAYLSFPEVEAVDLNYKIRGLKGL
jgi:hypothetical protein